LFSAYNAKLSPRKWRNRNNWWIKCYNCCDKRIRPLCKNKQFTIRN